MGVPISSTEKYDDLESADHNAVFILDRNGHIIAWNNDVECLAGYKAHEIIGRHIRVIYCTEDQMARKPELHLVLTTEKGKFESECMCRKKGGDLFLSCMIFTHLYDSNGIHSGFTVMTRDLSRLTKAEEKLHIQLKQANTELSLAYEKTLEGWSHALEMRDRETAGHTQRVAEMTVKLAAKMGIPDDQVIHIRRGALLHDIGKMAIPDSILLKRGPLTTQERAIMKKHPTYAYEMLSEIQYLIPAIDIPFCHHERWDGSGYPRGLRGRDIPLAARIFAVVDVWDAICSGRSYHSPWGKYRALQYVKSLSGTHFDPEVVSNFLEIASEI